IPLDPFRRKGDHRIQNPASTASGIEPGMAYQGDSGGYCLLTGLEVKVTIHRKRGKGNDKRYLPETARTPGRPERDRSLPCHGRSYLCYVASRYVGRR